MKPMDKIEQLLILSNDIKQDILDRKKMIDWDDDLMRLMEEDFLERLSNILPDEYRIDMLRKELAKFDKMYNL